MRPIKNIDWDMVDKMLEAGCQGTEIAARFGVHPNTFYDRVVAEKGCGFTEYQSIKRSNGDALLREAQFKKAMSGNTTMQIWLGKQRLDQTDKQENNFNAQVLHIRERDPTQRTDIRDTSQVHMSPLSGRSMEYSQEPEER